VGGGNIDLAWESGEWSLHAVQFHGRIGSVGLFAGFISYHII
jgi:hypothetical protein